MKKPEFFDAYTSYLKVAFVSLSFLIPLALLYYLYPQSFDLTWKGRTFYLFFVWLFILEIILGWDSYKTKSTSRFSNAHILIFCIALALPTIFVVIANFFGLNTIILNSARQNRMAWPWADWMPLSVEYLVFAVLFVVVVFLAYGMKGLKDFSMPAVFLGIIGAVYMIDNLYPYGEFTPFQIFVPTTATLAATFLNFLGFRTILSNSSGMPDLTVVDSQYHVARFQIAWPCSGVESLLIYTVTILLFLKKTSIPLKLKLIYFAIGAAVTYLINILRIVTIYLIALNGGDVSLFHDYYGQLFSIAWIASYPLIIIGTQTLLNKISLKKHVPQGKSSEFGTKNITV